MGKRVGAIRESPLRYWETTTQGKPGLAQSHQSHHRKSLRLGGYDYAQAGYYFVTPVIKDRQCILGEIVGEAMNLNDSGRMVAASWEWLGEQYPYVELDEYIVMPNHLHGIIVIKESGNGATASHGRGDSRIAPTVP